MVRRTLHPSLKHVQEEYVLIQAWKKTAAYIRRHNWFGDTLDLDLKAVDLKNFLTDIAQELKHPAKWKSRPLRLVLAPKGQDWWVRKDQESPNNTAATVSWQPRLTEPGGEPADVRERLRPLAHVSLRDQVVATALMLCLANRVETAQGDPRPPKKAETGNSDTGLVPFMSYGNRLFCDKVAGELRHRWGATKLYRSYYQDYREFLARPQRAAERVAGEDRTRQAFIVQVDLSRFYDRVRPDALHTAIEQRLKDRKDEKEFLHLATKVLDWSWCEKDDFEVGRYADAATIDGFARIALPQGLVSAGFWANVAMLDFDDAIRTTAFDCDDLKLADACRYVDDLRLVVTKPRAEGGSSTREKTEKGVAAAVGRWVQRLLCDKAPGLQLNRQKTVAVEFEADRAGVVLQSQRMNRIQKRVSGGFTASEGLELLESIQGLLMLRSGFTRDADKSSWKYAPDPEVPEDTRARFGAFRYRKVVRDIRAMLPDQGDPGTEEIHAGPGMSVVTRPELDELTRSFAYVLIEKWVNDPSNVRILLIALDLWPEAELLRSVLDLLRPWNQGDQGNPDAQRVAWYCLSEVLRAGATETGFGGDPESRPEKLCLQEYRRLLISEAWAVLKQTEPMVLPWYVRQQAFLLLFASESYSTQLNSASIPEDPPHYRRMAELLAGKSEQIDPSSFARNAIVLHRCFVKEIPAARWTFGRTEAAANLDAAFADMLMRQRDGGLDDPWAGLAQRLLVDRTSFHPNSLARLAMDGAFGRDELTLLRLALLLIKALQGEGVPKVLPPWRIVLKRNGEPDEEEPRVWPWESAHITDQASPDALDHWTPPRYCKPNARWRYQLGYLLRFALLRGPDFTANVSRRRPSSEQHYRSAASSWLQRKYGNYDGQSAFGGDWLPLSDWFERFLAALLWWPGRRRDAHGRVVDRGKAPTKAWVEERIELLEQHVGEATTVQFLPMSFSSSYMPKGLKTLRGAVVQTTYPAPLDFRDDLKLASGPARSRHRDHLTKALALVRQSLRLQEPGPQDGRPKLDLLILPELSVHPDDIERYLKPFARAFKTIVLAGVSFEALEPEKEELVNTAVWIIPEYSATNGWNVRSRRQGKLNLMALEDGRQQDGHSVVGYRPCQWIIECPASQATVKPLRLSASVCYDATDLGIVADLRERADVYLIPALNKDVQTFDNLAIALSYQMYQLVVVANNGRYGGSSAYWPIGEPHERRIMHLHGQDQPTLGFFEISDVVEYRRGRVENLPKRYSWKAPPAGYPKKAS
jgi:hypothetical protein